MDRREFVKKAAAAALLASIPAQAKQGSNDKKRERLACNSWPFRAYFDTPEMHHYRDPKYPLVMQWEFPQFLADHFDIHNVEFLPQHFPDIQPSTIDKVKEGLRTAKSGCCNLMGVEFTGGVFAPHADTNSMVQEAERWLGVAAALDCPTITVALTGKERPDAHVAAANLKPVVDAAHRRGKKVLFHNDDIKRESAEILSSVIGQLGRDRTGTCPDFGNFATKSAAYALNQLHILAPYASNICHAKGGIADHGVFYPDDFAASMKVMRDSGFHGLYSLEFEGLGPPLEGVRKLMITTEDYLT
ncbi:MAG TPA: TIM barrel protein [Bryobacteraceae bacterium]|jgi:sugar phosphate isomerase/epimerase|nr:TIM barrel protein [Bryobacteraceae bacterium]